ncbi:hypothetical protein JHK85_033609 [Glycine max]|nr:hypothetical protein JHK85_033609 [Glycine max]
MEIIMPSLERDLNDTRGYYESGKTKEASWRESQLKGLRRFLIEKQEDIMNALMHDLGKHQLEAFRDEAALPQLALLTSAEIVPEPLGVVLIISSWNFPFAIKVIQGGPKETQQLLEQRWDKIFFTGSAHVGKIVMSAAVKHLTPVTLELGGKCPAVVDSLSSSWNIEVAVKRIIVGKYGACAAEKALCYVNSCRFIEPTILVDPPLEAAIMSEEIFGPLLPIITVEKIEDSIKFINSRPKPLALYVFTKNQTLQRRMISETSSGSVTINDAILQYAVDTVPFGGVGESGFGMYHGKFSFDTFSHQKAIVRRSFLTDFWYRYPPWTLNKLQLLEVSYNYDYLGLLLVLLGLKRPSKRLISDHV